MADPKHLKILHKGVSIWNSWRMEVPYEFPDLAECDLSKLDLRGVNFLNTDLTGSNLTSSNLSNALFFGTFLQKANFNHALLGQANFREADLSYASFIRADLNGAKFSDSNLQETNFREARLYRTKFIDIDLRMAEFKGAKFGNTILGRSNLSGAKSLDQCFHETPSIVDPTTFAKSGRLPLEFLRGCGVPDIFIEYLPSMIVDPIQLYSCFISYSSKDQKFATKLYNDLQNNGVRCWFAPHDLKTGDRIRPVVDESIRIYDKLLLILSKYSVESQWVEQEVETALERERREKKTILFPIRIDDTVMKIQEGWPALIRNTRNIGDFRYWKNETKYSESLGRLLRDFRNDVGNSHLKSG